jgi:tetratricopeptide (TPR) repeat protein
MADYYQLLGIRKDATSTEIRTAYKRLAMLYHPDRNQDNPEAEELFKLINEAYHVLADPLKKQRYDARFSMGAAGTHHSSAHDTAAYWREYHCKRYEQWRQAQQGSYHFDKRYLRIQALAIGVFLAIAGFCFMVVNVIEYFHKQQLAATHKQNLALVQQINVLFHAGKQEEAFVKINQLQEEAPLEYIFTFAEDSLINSLRNLANDEFENEAFDKAGRSYRLLQKYEDPVRPLTLQRIAECEYINGEYEQSLTVLKQLLEKQPRNIDLIHRMAVIYQDDLHDLEQALHYLNLGRKNFKDYMTNIYGEAFEIIMDPSYVHDIYYDIFRRRALVNLNLKKYDDALKDCNWAVALRPQLGWPYYQRAVTAIRLNNTSRLCEDLQRAVTLGNAESVELKKRYCGR